MALFKTRGVDIAGIACAVPSHREDRADHEKRFTPEAVDRVLASTEIESIHIGQDIGQTAGDLGYAAANRLLSDLKIDRDKIGILLFVSYAVDYLKPGTSSVIHKRLGLSSECIASDIGHACAGFVYGHQFMESLMMSTDVEYGLLIVADTGNRIVNRMDHTSLMLGDAGAAILYKRDEATEHKTLLKADGSRFSTIVVPGGGFRDPNPDRELTECSDGISRTPYDLYMDGLGVLSFSTNDVVDTIHEYLDKTDQDLNDFDMVVFHQANMFIIKRMIKKLKLQADRVPVSLHEYGNTSCASIPITICHALGDVSDRSHVKILASGFGIGLAWGVTSFHLDSSAVLPVFETDECYSEGILDLSKM